MKVMTPEEALKVKLQALLDEHRRLNEEVDTLAGGVGVPSLELQRLKKRKLALKDQINALQDRLRPDIIA
ncbi:MAG: YdcH family protein [Pseudomonadota bacterium]